MRVHFWKKSSKKLWLFLQKVKDILKQTNFSADLLKSPLSWFSVFGPVESEKLQTVVYLSSHHEERARSRQT